MKLRYSENSTAVFYRKSKKDRKKAGKLRKRILIGSLKTLTLLTAVTLLLVFGYKVLANRGVFNIKAVTVIPANEKSENTFEEFNELNDLSIFKLNRDMCLDILIEHYPQYGLKTVTKSFPSSVRIVIYRRIPVIRLNEDFAVNNDMTINRERNIQNCVKMTTDVNFRDSAFTIPGLATLMNAVIKHKDEIREIRNRDNLYRVILNDGRNILLHAGEKMPDLNSKSVNAYKYSDIRFNNIILVKN